MRRRYLPVMSTIALSVFGCAPTWDLPHDTPVLGGGGGVESLAEKAREDLARRKGVDKGDITVVMIEAVDWPDTSLGCPRPDMMYAQVITPGFKIVLSHADETYVYHSDRSTRVVYCRRTSP